MERINSYNPCKGDLIGSYPVATEEDVNNAVKNAREAQKSWKKLSRVNRAEYFDALAQLIKRDVVELTHILSLETGKSLNEAKAEVMESLHMIQVTAAMGKQEIGQIYSSELATKDAYVVRKPKGVVAIISPWNFPLAIGATWCAGPALVEGNTVVHKCSELTPTINVFMEKLYREAKFPENVYTLIHGAEITGKALVQSDVDCILFTGSAEVGQEIRRHCADTWHKTCSCELGSKSSVITFEDGNLDLAVDVSVASAFKLSGQRCVSSGRLLVQRSVYDQFVEKFLDKVKNDVSTGDPFEKEYYYGPLISMEQKRKVHDFNQMVRDDVHAMVLYDPEPRPQFENQFLQPFVYKCEWRDKPFLKNEVFGPHVAIIPFDTVEDAIRIYNDTDYGLALGIVTDDYRKHRLLLDECKTGMFYVNGGSVAAESHLPFGGVKKSGNGFKSAAGTWRAVTNEVAVTVNYEEGRMQFCQGMK